jgi:hypothetical protein
MGKTYFIDLDGTLVHHKTIADLDKILTNPTLREHLLKGVQELWTHFSDDDYIVITTARSSRYQAFTERIFVENSLRYNKILFDLQSGPRVLINDTPNIASQKAIAINVQRNAGFYFEDEGPLFKFEN